MVCTKIYRLAFEIYQKPGQYYRTNRVCRMRAILIIM